MFRRAAKTRRVHHRLLDRLRSGTRQIRAWARIPHGCDYAQSRSRSPTTRSTALAPVCGPATARAPTAWAAASAL